MFFSRNTLIDSDVKRRLRLEFSADCLGKRTESSLFRFQHITSLIFLGCIYIYQHIYIIINRYIWRHIYICRVSTKTHIILLLYRNAMFDCKQLEVLSKHCFNMLHCIENLHSISCISHIYIYVYKHITLLWGAYVSSIHKEKQGTSIYPSTRCIIALTRWTT